MAQKVEPRNVSLYPSDWKIIDGADANDAGTSATLRRIVREWSIAIAPKDDLHRALSSTLKEANNEKA